MKKIKNYENLADNISEFLRNYAVTNGLKTLVVGVSGGIDSAVVSTLCARTGLPTILVTMGINKLPDSNATSHIGWLESKYPNVVHKDVDLTSTFDTLVESIIGDGFLSSFDTELAKVNTRSRCRMVTLYFIANSTNGMVVGTGNRVEDFGIGFFTKFGDGGVDISPIGDLMKSEVRELGRHLGVSETIIEAAPTDGLWDDPTKTDEAQIGATYGELEWAMDTTIAEEFMTQGEKVVMAIYQKRHTQNQHKMQMPPTFDTTKDRK